jgi:hypothetical protein
MSGASFFIDPARMSECVRGMERTVAAVPCAPKFDQSACAKTVEPAITDLTATQS